MAGSDNTLFQSGAELTPVEVADVVQDDRTGYQLPPSPLRGARNVAPSRPCLPALSLALFTGVIRSQASRRRMGWRWSYTRLQIT